MRPSVVLLRDGRWPQVPGVCCWRHGVSEAFAAAGATVGETTWRTRAPSAPKAPAGPRPGGQSGKARLAWLPWGIRTPAIKAYHRARALSGAVVPRRHPPVPGVAGASLIIAESVDAAMAAVAGGAPGPRIWALVLPADRLPPDIWSGPAADVAQAAEVVGGFLTHSDAARDEVERCAAMTRPRVRVFPPLTTDRPCPECAGSVAEPSDEQPAEVAQLARWRAVIDEPEPAQSTVDGSAARLGVSDARGARQRLSRWGAADVDSPSPTALDLKNGATTWRAAAQDRVARELVDLVTPQPSEQRIPRRALIAGHDLKFARDLAERLGNRSDLAVTVDDWPELGRGTGKTRARLRQAESIFAEWARTSAVWLAEHKRPDQFLAVRLHRFELDAAYPRQLDIDKVDAVVYIAPLFGRRIQDELGWPAEKLVYIPNFIDLDWLDRPKLTDARFAIGLVGVEWIRKRFDLALDLLAALRREDLRYTLVVRSVMPWHNQYAWAKSDERTYVTACFNRIERDPLLRGGVIFEPPGRDMARWLRGIGHILSTSDEEGSHTAVTEGMASGAVPVVRPWPGAGEIYGSQWLQESPTAAVAAILESADAQVWAEHSELAKAEARRTHDPVAVVDAWADLLHGEVDEARKYFAQYSSLTM